MSDERLRELERAFLRSGAPADERALLGARLRAGLLDQRRLALAASLGHAPAREVLADADAGSEVPSVQPFQLPAGHTHVPPTHLTPFFGRITARELAREIAEGRIPAELEPRLLRLCAPDPWCDLLRELGPTAPTRAALAAARVAWPAYRETFHADTHGPHRADPGWAARSLRAARAWAVCPCPAHLDALRAHDPADPARDELWDGQGGDTLAWRARKAYKRGLDRGLCAYAAIAAPRALAAPLGAPQPFEGGGSVGLRGALSGAAVCGGEAALLATLAAGLVPWALGHGDPLRG